MSAAPAVSVVVTTYNRAPALRLALESLRRQTFTDWEALVIGDGCTDGSGAIVESLDDPRFRWHNLPENSGSQAVPNNTGLAMARGRWVAYLGHDDLWFPWHLEDLVDAIEANDADFAHALVAYFSVNGLVGCWGAPASGTTYAEHNIPPSTWLHRRELAIEVGGWADPLTLDLWVDFHLSRRMALAGARFAFHPGLSVLKFPAPNFPGAYLNENPLPQAEMLRSMILDSEELEVGLLQESANFLARLQHHMAARGIAAMLAEGGSPESVQRFQDERRSQRQRSGLDRKDGGRAVAPPEIRSIALEEVLAGSPCNADQDDASTLWVRCAGATPETFVLLDGTPLASCVKSSDLVTAIVPGALTAEPGAKTLVLLNGGGSSHPVELLVR
jgi:hypothetical protein